MSYIGNTVQNQNYVPAIDYFNGNGSTVAFTLSRPVASVAAVQAVINNVPQNPGSAFTVSGSTITFTSAPPSGTNNIYVYYTSPNTQVVQPGQGTVGTTSLQDASVTVSKISATGTPSANTVLKGDGSWAPAGYNGATTTSSSGDLTLTNSSTQVQYVTMTATAKYVVLPDATTLSKGGVVYTIINNGGYPFGIKDAAGNILNFSLEPNLVATYFLVDNSSVAGVWSTVNAPCNVRGATDISVSTIASAPNMFYDCVWLSASLVVFRNSSSIVAATVSGTTVTWGTPVTVAAVVAGEANVLSAINATTGVILRRAGNTGTAVTLTAFTVSGTTITLGAASTLQTAASGTNYGNVISIDPATNKGVCTYSNGTSFVTRIFTVSGTTITLGAAYTTTQFQFVAPCLGSTTTFIGITSPSTYAQIVTYSGTTISSVGTAGTQLTILDGAQTICSPLAISSTQTLFNGSLITYSGTSITSVTYMSTGTILSMALVGSSVLAVMVSGFNPMYWLLNVQPVITKTYIGNKDLYVPQGLSLNTVSVGQTANIAGNPAGAGISSQQALYPLSSSTWGYAAYTYGGSGAATPATQSTGYLCIMLGNVI